MKQVKLIYFVFFFSIFLLGLSSCDTTLAAQNPQYSNPSWIPAYTQGVRYYYMPDIETYYDLSNQDFVYLDNGQWQFSASLPLMYSNYDLYNGYSIALNSNVYQPWMHHQLYVSNYPRYYYRNRYNSNEMINIRGFNENERKPFYWKPEERNNINEVRKNNRHDDRHEPSRPPQTTHYYGKNLGQPVKVQSQMREHKQENNSGGKQGNRNHDGH